MKVFRPDKFNPLAFSLIQTVLGPECRDDYTIDLKSAILSIKSK